MTRAPIVALALTLAACTSHSPTPKASRSASTRPSTVVLAENLRLFEGRARVTRIAFQPVAASTDVIVDFTPDSAQVTLCPLTDATAELPSPTACKNVGAGVRETVSAPGMRALAIVLANASSARANVRLEFDDAGHDVAFHLPTVPEGPGASACKDNGCNPFFELMPVRNGPFSARASWTGPAGSLILLQGSVLGRSFSATGFPYREAARANGSSPLSISDRLGAPGEYALVLVQQQGPTAGPLGDVVITASWP
jgi:hypothetical protein